MNNPVFQRKLLLGGFVLMWKHFWKKQNTTQQPSQPSKSFSCSDGSTDKKHWLSLQTIGVHTVPRLECFWTYLPFYIQFSRSTVGGPQEHILVWRTDFEFSRSCLLFSERSLTQRVSSSQQHVAEQRQALSGRHGSSPVCYFQKRLCVSTPSP